MHILLQSFLVVFIFVSCKAMKCFLKSIVSLCLGPDRKTKSSWRDSMVLWWKIVAGGGHEFVLEQNQNTIRRKLDVLFTRHIEIT